MLKRRDAMMIVLLLLLGAKFVGDAIAGLTL